MLGVSASVPNVVKEWFKGGLWGTTGTGISSTGLLDMKQVTTTVFTSQFLEIAGFSKFALGVVSTQTGTVNAATVAFTADLYAYDGQVLAQAIPIVTLTMGVTTNENQYLVAFGPGMTTSWVKSGTSPGADPVTTGEKPFMFLAASKIKLKATIGTASTATTSTIAVYFKAQP